MRDSRPQQTSWSRYDHCGVSSASHQAACLARSKAADEVLPALMRYTRPLSVCSETRLRPSFFRTTPARKARPEGSWHLVSVAGQAVVAPAGVCSIAMMRSCCVPGRATRFDDAGAGRLRDLDLLDFREAEWVAALGFDLGLVMGSSEVCATPSVAPPQPRLGKSPAGQDPEARLSRPPSRHSNAPIKPQSQSIVSKIVAHWSRFSEVFVAPVRTKVRPQLGEKRNSLLGASTSVSNPISSMAHVEGSGMPGGISRRYGLPNPFSNWPQRRNHLAASPVQIPEPLATNLRDQNAESQGSERDAAALPGARVHLRDGCHPACIALAAARQSRPGHRARRAARIL